MKKIILLIIFILGAGLAVNNWPRIKSWTAHIPEVSESIRSGNFVNDIKQEISAPGLLKGNLEAANTRLTVAGTVRWTNTNRSTHGLPALAENKVLNQAAQNKLQDMFDKQYFEHVSPEGKGPGDVVAAVDYHYVAVGENLALGNFTNDEKLVEAWMNSPGHRANILSEKFTEIGVAVGKGTYEGRTTWLAVQTFAKPAAACPAIDSTLKFQVQNYQQEIDSLESQIRRNKSELEAANPQTREEYEVYNANVREHNDLVKLYNNKIDVAKQLVARYNEQVNAFNACVGK